MAELVGSVHEFTHEQFVKCMSNEAFRNFILEEVQVYIEKYEMEKSEVDKKHDKIIKNIISIKKEGVKHLNKKFHLNLKLDEVELYDKEFRQKGGKVLEADIIYKMKDRNVFFLIERQTKKDYHMPFKILKYEMEIMRTCEAKGKEEKEAMVLASVIHTGPDKWDVPTSLLEIQEDIDNGIEKILGNVKNLGNYGLEDVNDYTKEELLESDSLLDKVMYLEKIRDTNDFLESIREVYKRINAEEKKEMDEVVRIALSGNMIPEEIEEFIIELNEGGEGTMLALKERIDADFKRQREEGKREGIKIGEERAGEINLNIGRKERKKKWTT